MKNYIELAARTKTGLKVNVNQGNEDLLHGAIGCATESGELLDAVKKHLFYGKPLDVINIREELGDLFWYMAMLADFTGITFEELQEMNIEKLRIRYPEKFTEELASNRNLEAERKVLEK